MSAALVFACGDETDPAATAKPTVLATTGVAADIVGEIAGDRLEVLQLVPNGSSPHNYAPSAREQGGLSRAALVVYFSDALEQSLPLERAERRFAFADHIARVRDFAADDLEQGEDPHLWLDPTQVRAALPALAEALAAIDPAGAEAYRRRAETYAAELSRLDAELERILATIPATNRKLVTSHDSMGYYADRYDLDFVGSPFGAAPEAAASAGELGELIERIVDAGAVAGEGVPAIFAQSEDDPEVLEQVGREAGVEVVTDLEVTALGDSDSYVEMMRTATQRIADALTR